MPTPLFFFFFGHLGYVIQIMLEKSKGDGKLAGVGGEEWVLNKGPGSCGSTRWALVWAFLLGSHSQRPPQRQGWSPPCPSRTWPRLTCPEWWGKGQPRAGWYNLPGSQSCHPPPATKKNRGSACSSLALYLAVIISAMGWISCLAASNSPSSSESTIRTRQGPSLVCTVLESESSSTGLGCHGCPISFPIFEYYLAWPQNSLILNVLYFSPKCFKGLHK